MSHTQQAIEPQITLVPSEMTAHWRLVFREIDSQGKVLCLL